MKLIQLILLSLSIYSAEYIQAQSLTQTIRGTITDKVSQIPIPGATVVVQDLEPKKGAVTDEDGNFKITNVPVGRQNLIVSMMGYKTLTLPNIVVNSGKEVVLTISMEEEISETQEVVITGKVDKTKPLNDMSAVSARTFSVEETQKYAAAVNDPARMAMAFPGVVQTDDGNNGISIRGNSPNGLLWRMEGVDIPNPNHFSSVGTSGGGISILSSQLLTNSDFTTGAFAAEYGNALSGVFDLKLRKGNNEKREYTLQAGFLGIDLATEGPFKKGYGGSYLINYRYSTLGILAKVGVPLGDAITTFQDLSYNIYLPTKHAGNFGFFGFGGLSSQTLDAKKDSTTWEDYSNRIGGDFRANTGAAGLTHTKIIHSKGFLKTALVYSGTRNGYYEEELDYSYVPQLRYNENHIQYKISLNSTYNHKFNPKLSLRTGIIANRLHYSLTEKYADSTDQLITTLDDKGNTFSIQAFAQTKYKFTEKLSLHTGIHYLHFMLNNTWSIEPRAALSYDLSTKQSLSFGYGLHSQILPLGIYFAKSENNNGSITYPNKSLDLSKAHHYVLSHNWMVTESFRVKTEVYYQALFNIAQESKHEINYSILNSEDGYTQRTLSNTGAGKNYGLELTLEQFMKRNFYLLGSASLFESKYKASDNNWYNTKFNTNFAFTLTTGKEFILAEKYKKRVFGVHVKVFYTGGLRETPIDQQASIASGNYVVEYDKAYTDKAPAYFRTDIKISLKRNYKNATGTIAFDAQNATNQQNIGGYDYDPKTFEKRPWYQAPLIPILSYKLEF